MPTILFDRKVDGVLNYSLDTRQIKDQDGQLLVGLEDFKDYELSKESSDRVIAFIDKYISENPGSEEIFCFSILDKFRSEIGPILLKELLLRAPDIVNAFNHERNTLLMKICGSYDRAYPSAFLLMVNILIGHNADLKILSEFDNSNCRRKPKNLANICQAGETVLHQFIRIIRAKPPSIYFSETRTSCIQILALLAKNHNPSEMQTIFNFMNSLTDEFVHGVESYKEICSVFHKVVQKGGLDINAVVADAEKEFAEIKANKLIIGSESLASAAHLSPV